MKKEIMQKKQGRILVVEDDGIVQKVHKSMLERLGYQVDIAMNGSEALRLSENNYNAILMDIGLPDINGLEVTLQIRKREQENNLKRIPIIATTTYGYEEDKQNCFKAGIDDVAIKPISLGQIEEILNKWVSH